MLTLYRGLFEGLTISPVTGEDGTVTRVQVVISAAGIRAILEAATAIELRDRLIAIFGPGPALEQP